MTLTIRRLDTGHWSIRGTGYLYAQPPHWPCSESVLRAHIANLNGSSNRAVDAFVREAMKRAASDCERHVIAKGDE